MNRVPTSLSRDDILAALGLEMRPAPTDMLVPALTVFGVGIVIGAGVGLLFAPRPGRETRADLSRRLQEVPDTLAALPDQAAKLARRTGEALGQARKQVEGAARELEDQAGSQ